MSVSSPSSSVFHGRIQMASGENQNLNFNGEQSFSSNISSFGSKLITVNCITYKPGMQDDRKSGENAYFDDSTPHNINSSHYSRTSQSKI
jgi:hypothetical protein